MAWIISGALDPTDDTEATIAERKTALSGIFTEASQLHDSNFAIVTYKDDTFFDKALNDRSQRLEVMGDPERYIVILPQEPLDGDAHDGRPGNRWEVFVYYGQGTASVSSADAAFDAVMGDVSSTKPGLMYLIQRQKEFISVTDHTLVIDLVATPVYGRYQIDRTNDDYWWIAHLVLNVA